MKEERELFFVCYVLDVYYSSNDVTQLLKLLTLFIE